ncbi:MAG: zinc-dependent metalloprotease [Gemmatimonadetes bacterium]|nr:zinc-dependent metalloprotease [Gemmatimonadota bacterium]
MRTLTDHLRSVILRAVAAFALASLVTSFAAAELTAQEALPTIEEKTASMRAIDGFIPLYWEASSGKLWMEVARWDTDLLHMTGLASGLGSNDIGLDRGALAGSRLVRFQRVGPKVLLVQPNLDFRASSTNANEVRAVTDAFAPSTLWGFTAAAETGDRVLVDGTSFFVRDMIGWAQRMRPGTYRLDESRSAIHLPMTMGFPENTEIEASLTFVLQPGSGGRVIRGPWPSSGAPGGFFEGVRDVAAAGEAATLRLHHSFVQLPELGEYTPRRFDPRAGYGSMAYADYSAPLGEPMVQRFIRRHRLEKADPSAEMSDPVEPIVYYLDTGAPEPIRTALLEGARWWNQAFEAAGYRDAFRVEMLPDGVSSHDVRYNVINWVHRSTRGWSTGGSVTDPRTGEILKGVVTLGSLRWRQDYMIAEGLLAPYANGDEQPAELAEWALARIRQLSAHEIGHTLGLGHNYYDSEVGRISVMDYPHPLVTLGSDGALDYSEVYDVDIGEWDKVAIRYGYEHFPDGMDEAAALARILDDAWAEDVIYFTNQDVSTHPKADQWSNGTHAADELDRMMAVRRHALDRFGSAAIRSGRPISTLEEVLVPLYMHHRYQVDAAASMLGGIDYVYAMRGDGRDPMTRVSATDQRAALDALLATLDPGELALPDAVLDVVPPRPPGYGRTRELFPRYTGSAFDAISPAVVAADHTVSQMLQPSRAARLLEQHTLDPSLPGLGDVLDGLFGVAHAHDDDTRYEAEIRRAVARVIFDRLMTLAASAPMPQVRAEATKLLKDVHDALGARPDTDDAQGAFSTLLAVDLGRFLERPAEPYDAPATPGAPPGAPIGQPAPDPLGDVWSSDASWIHAGPAGWATHWFESSEACSFDARGGF